MDEAALWQLVDTARQASGGDCAEQTKLLVEQLAQREPAEIEAFDALFWDLMARSYRWDLWAAAYIINGGCSDDGFDYFRGWLIAQGKVAFYAALADPETLIGVPPAEDVSDTCVECEDMLSVGALAYEQRTGRRLPNPPADQVAGPVEPAGDPWDEEEVEALFPRLAAWVEGVQGAGAG